MVDKHQVLPRHALTPKDPLPLPHTSETVHLNASDQSTLARVPCAFTPSHTQIEKHSNSIFRFRAALEPVLETPLSFTKQLNAGGHANKGTTFDLISY